MCVFAKVITHIAAHNLMCSDVGYYFSYVIKILTLRINFRAITTHNNN